MGWNGQPVQLVELSNKLEILKGQTSGSQPNIIDINDKKKSVGAHPSWKLFDPMKVQDVRLRFFLAQMKCFPRPLAEI
jgi:hypothetical protein